MKKLLVTIMIVVGLSACQTAENTNVQNKNANVSYNQNRALENLRQQLNEQSSNSRKIAENIQNQIEGVNTNTQNVNKPINNQREKLHEIEPETR